MLNLLYYSFIPAFNTQTLTRNKKLKISLNFCKKKKLIILTDAKFISKVLYAYILNMYSIYLYIRTFITKT